MSADISIGPRPLGPADASPPRRINSIRRTSTIDSTWSDGMHANREVTGFARDLITPDLGREPILVAQDELFAVIEPNRSIVSLKTFPEREDIHTLVDAGNRRYSRWQISKKLPQEAESGTPLYLLLDDLIGVFVVEHVAGGIWNAEDPTSLSASMLANDTESSLNLPVVREQRVMAGTCAGLAPGSNALNSDGTYRGPMRNSSVPVIENVADNWGWHSLPNLEGMSHRRARRIDVWVDQEQVHVEAFFQDSFTHPSGQRYAAHEYNVFATADLESGNVVSISAEPRILPLDLCPLATQSVHKLIGHSLQGFRDSVNKLLPGVEGCTHMNDTLRSLAEVPVLVRQLLEATS